MHNYVQRSFTSTAYLSTHTGMIKITLLNYSTPSELFYVLFYSRIDYIILWNNPGEDDYEQPQKLIRNELTLESLEILCAEDVVQPRKNLH